MSGAISGTAGAVTSWTTSGIMYEASGGQYGSAFSLETLGRSVAVGAIAGGIGGAVGGFAGSELGFDKLSATLTGTSAGSLGGYGTSLLFGGEFTWQDMALSLGSSLAGALASYGAGELAESKSEARAARTGDRSGKEVIGPNFKSGAKIPANVRQMILKEGAAPEMAKAVDAARLYHASQKQIAELAAQLGVSPSEANSFAEGTKIYAAPGRGFTLRELAHEVTHVNQYLADPENFSRSYEKETAYQRAMILKGETSNPEYEAYLRNKYEVEASRIEERVLSANPGY